MTAVALSVGVVLLLSAAIVLAYQWYVRQNRKEKVLIEDALKHLYHSESQQHTCTLESISGALGVKPDRAAGVTGTLIHEGLVAQDRGTFRLTQRGRAQALSVIRRHRLYERYLADETGVQPTRWHAVADEKEHALTPDEVNALARRLGDPLYDPHGDPIPPSVGTMPSQRGGPLQSARPGSTLMVVHVEDEPESVFQDLAMKGFQPGIRVRVVSRDDRSVEVEIRDTVVSLSLLTASNVTVMPAPPVVHATGTLESIQLGHSARVVGIDDACRGLQRRRMLDLGLVPGTIVTAELPSPLGDPVAYRIRGSLIALRHAQASLILVEPTEAQS